MWVMEGLGCKREKAKSPESFSAGSLEQPRRELLVGSGSVT